MWTSIVFLTTGRTRLSSEIIKLVLFLNYPTAKCSNAALILLVGLVWASQMQKLLAFTIDCFSFKTLWILGLFRSFQGWRIPSLERKGPIFRAESCWRLQTPPVNSAGVCCWHLLLSEAHSWLWCQGCAARQGVCQDRRAGLCSRERELPPASSQLLGWLLPPSPAMGAWGAIYCSQLAWV